MKIKKVLETRIDVFNINDIYCSDYNKSVIQMLKDKFALKCFKSIYILDILRIVNRSTLQCKSKVLDGSVYIDVTFEVLGIVYDKGDIIHNCKIIQINNNGIIHAKSAYASLYIKNILDVHIFKENDEIPVIVNMSRYNIYDTEISVSSIPLIPILKKSTIYRILSDDKKDLDKQIASLFNFKELDDIETSIKNMSKSHKVVFNFFKNLLYPFKKIQKNYGTENIISLENLLSLMHLDMIYIPDSYLDDNTYLKLSEADKNKIISSDVDTSVIDISKQEFILYILNNYYKNLSYFIEFLQTYDTPEKVESKKPFWSLYKTFKK